MSRIILKKYPRSGEDQIVVGWDHPCDSFFWQEFNEEPEADQSGEVNWDGWEEMLGFGGYMPHELPSIRTMISNMPKQYRHLVTDPVKMLLLEHRDDPESGRKPPVDVSEDVEKEVSGA